MILPTKISFHVVSKRKRGCRIRCKTRQMLAENCPEATPAPENSDVSFIEQSGTPRENVAPVKS